MKPADQLPAPIVDAPAPCLVSIDRLRMLAEALEDGGYNRRSNLGTIEGRTTLITAESRLKDAALHAFMPKV